MRKAMLGALAAMLAFVGEAQARCDLQDPAAASSPPSASVVDRRSPALRAAAQEAASRRTTEDVAEAQAARRAAARRAPRGAFGAAIPDSALMRTRRIL